MDALIISADDYGYSAAYDRGILEAAEAGAIDAVSVMVERPGMDPWALATTDVELGLHLEVPVGSGVLRRAATQALERQLEGFREAFRHEPAFIDGHHHCHAAPSLAGFVARRAAEVGAVVRSIDEGHRRRVHAAGARTPDLLVGRLDDLEPALPAEINALLLGAETPPGVIEWMVHPGHPESSAGSGYDRGRAEDLRLVLGLMEEPAVRRLRATHTAAVGGR